MPSLAASHSVGRTDPPINSMVQTGQVMMNMMREGIYERNREIYNIISPIKALTLHYIFHAYL